MVQYRIARNLGICKGSNIQHITNRRVDIGGDTMSSWLRRSTPYGREMMR